MGSDQHSIHNCDRIQNGCDDHDDHCDNASQYWSTMHDFYRSLGLSQDLSDMLDCEGPLWFNAVPTCICREDRHYYYMRYEYGEPGESGRYDWESDSESDLVWDYFWIIAIITMMIGFIT